MNTTTLSHGWSDELESEIKSRSNEDFPITFGMNGDDYSVFAKAINQGIDSHLEAVRFEQRDNTFTITADTLHVLVRRLLSADDALANDFGSVICEAIGIELV